MFMGGESGKSCADEGNRFICNRGHIGSWEKNTFAYPTREQMNQVSGLKPNMVSIKGGQRGTYCYTQNLDMKCGSGSPNTLAHWFTVGGADPVKADWTGGGFGSADKKFDYFISLKSNEAGGAFCNDARGSSTIKCDKPTVGKGETFHMLWPSTEESKSADEKAAAEKIAINSAPAPPPSPCKPLKKRQCSWTRLPLPALRAPPRRGRTTPFVTHIQKRCCTAKKRRRWRALRRAVPCCMATELSSSPARCMLTSTCRMLLRH